MGKAIPQEMEKEIQQRLNEEFALAKWEAQKMAETKFAAEIEPLLRSVEKKLEERGFDTDRSAVHNSAVESLLDVLTGEVDMEESVDISVAGRENKDLSKEATMSPTEDTPTKTIEVPIEGGNVENPDTVEREVIDPDKMDFDMTEEFHEWGDRINADPEDESQGSESEDVPTGGFPWYQ